MSNKFKKLLEPEMLVAISAIFISLCALVVSVHESKIMRESQFASVWPYVDFNLSFGDDYFDLGVSNDGIGPAKIKYIKFSNTDTVFYFVHNFINYINQKDSLRINKYSYSNLTGGVMRASESISLFSTKDSIAIKNLLIHFGNYNYEVCFCSVFDECWVRTKYDTTPCKICPDLEHLE